MREPRHKRAMRELQASADAMAEEGLMIRKTRNTTPPDDWDDLPISYTRGQPWSRNRNE
jgi:hypothetical protein